MKTFQIKNNTFAFFAILIFAALIFYGFSKKQPDKPAVEVASVSLDKMKTLYLGVDNPVTIAISNVAAEDTQVNSKNIDIKKHSPWHYSLIPQKKGLVKLSVFSDQTEVQEFEYSVQQLPDPIPTYAGRTSGSISAENFKKHTKIELSAGSAVFKYEPSVHSFSLTHVPKRKDPVEVINTGAGFNERALALILNAESGDVYYFDKILANCPDNVEPRKLGSMIFKIK